MKSVNLVQKLRDRKFTVKVTHFRRYIDWGNKIQNLQYMSANVLNRIDFIAADIIELPTHQSPGLNYALPKGGATFVEVITPSGNYYSSEAVCSDKDQFNRKLATKIAINRILNMLRENSEWDD